MTRLEKLWIAAASLVTVTLAALFVWSLFL